MDLKDWNDCLEFLGLTERLLHEHISCHAGADFCLPPAEVEKMAGAESSAKGPS